MNKNTRVVALKIALLMEENTKKDITEAIELLIEKGGDKSILDNLLKLSNNSKYKPSERVRQSESLNPQKRLSIDTEIHKEGKGKDYILKEFERLVKGQHILRSKDALDNFGSKIDKEIDLNKSRDEIINKILLSMNSMSVDDLRKIVNDTLPNQNEKQSTSYHALARFLIEGKKP